MVLQAAENRSPLTSFPASGPLPCVSSARESARRGGTTRPSGDRNEVTAFLRRRDPSGSGRQAVFRNGSPRRWSIRMMRIGRLTRWRSGLGRSVADPFQTVHQVAGGSDPVWWQGTLPKRGPNLQCFQSGGGPRAEGPSRILKQNPGVDPKRGLSQIGEDNPLFGQQVSELQRPRPVSTGPRGSSGP